MAIRNMKQKLVGSIMIGIPCVLAGWLAPLMVTLTLVGLMLFLVGLVVFLNAYD